MTTSSEIRRFIIQRGNAVALVVVCVGMLMSILVSKSGAQQPSYFGPNNGEISLPVPGQVYHGPYGNSSEKQNQPSTSNQANLSSMNNVATEYVEQPRHRPAMSNQQPPLINQPAIGQPARKFSSSFQQAPYIPLQHLPQKQSVSRPPYIPPQPYTPPQHNYNYPLQLTAAAPNPNSISANFPTATHYTDSQIESLPATEKPVTKTTSNQSNSVEQTNPATRSPAREVSDNLVDRKSETSSTDRLPSNADRETKTSEQAESDNATSKRVKLPAQAASTKKPNRQLGDTNKPLLAAQPKIGDHFYHDKPCVDPSAVLIPYEKNDFPQDPLGPPIVDPWAAIDVYTSKHLNPTQRPLIEWGRDLYGTGQFRPASTLLGDTNLMTPQFIVFGDWRTAIAKNRSNANETTQIATRLNLDYDLKITSTERLHAFVRPFDTGNRFTRVELDSGNIDFQPEFDFEFDTGFFEGDLGAIAGGMTNTVLPFDLPFAVGQIPLLMQNGIWMDDAFLGIAATIPAKNSPRLDWPNFDTTFFWGFDNITSPAFQGDDNAAKMYGITSWIEAYGGYVELGYVFLEDRTFIDRSYHNIGLSFTRRYGWLSNSVRVIANGGQTPNGIGATADGLCLLLENSLVTRKPYTVVPYFNMFAGFGRPQSVARAQGTGGILRNTGINFETDGLTGYPTLDASATESWGGALGINLLSDKLDHQLVLEFAFLQAMGFDPVRQAVDDQYGVGARYQKPISNSVLIRADVMYGFFEQDEDIFGTRIELRKKF